MVFQAPLASPAIFSIKAKDAIKDTSAVVDPASFLPSMKLNAATATDITAIAVTIAVRFALQSFAPLVAQIIAVITIPRAVTAATPLRSILSSTKPIRIDTAARAAIAIEMARIVADIFATLSSFEILVTRTKIPINTRNPAANAAPFFISSADNIDINLHTPTNKVNENETESTKRPSPLIPPSGYFFVTATRAPTNIVKPIANAAPFSISSADNNPISFVTPTNSPMASDNLIIIPPTLLTLSPAKCDNKVNIPTKTPNAVTNAPAFNISSLDMFAIFFIAVASKIIDTDILSIIVPTSDIFD